MAYLIFTAHGEEYDRRELLGPMVIGRAPDCDVSIHDIILSRHHCRIESIEENGQQWWVIHDLHSKNGTHLRGTKIEQHTLHEGDELRVGRTRLTFRAGVFVPSSKPRKKAVTRAADPSEALAGTVSGMVVCEPGETQFHPGLPTPKPRPADPSAYMRDDVYGMINEIISSSWDSVMAQNSQPIRMQRAMPSPMMTKAVRGAVQPKPRVSFALQARAEHEEPVPAPVHSRSRRSRITFNRRSWIYATATIVAVLLFFAIRASVVSRAAAQEPEAAPIPSSDPQINTQLTEPDARAFVDADFSTNYLVAY